MSLTVIVASIIGALLLYQNQGYTLEEGNYIIEKQNNDRPMILVASGITGRDAKLKTVREFMDEKVDLMWYRLDDIALYRDLQIGDRVTVKVKTFEMDGQQVTLIDQSYPPQTDAEEVIRH